MYWIPGGIVLILLAAIIFKKRQTRLRRKQLISKALPEEYISIITKNIPLYSKLPGDLKQQLGGLVNIFLAEKDFIGCMDQEISDEVRVTIAAQACMLLLNRKTNYYPKLKTIYVFPHTYVARQISSDGYITIEGKSVRLGESWQNGPVVLAWDSVIGGARNIRDGRNVVIHEFSHRLDQEDGDGDGAPILESRGCYKSWAEVLGHEFENLQRKTRKRRKSVVRSYGATNPAEFFAVATEAFFEKPKQMNKRHPELYRELKSYYKVDPLEWMTTRGKS